MFIDTSGVQYLLDRYVSGADREELQRLNTSYSRDEFTKKLKNAIERGSGSTGWIPPKYDDDLAHNAAALIGTTRARRSLKNKREVDTYETRSGRIVYEDNRGNLRDYRTGRFVKGKVFEE